MRRIALTALTCVLTLAGAVALGRARWLDAAMAEGRALFEHRMHVRRILSAPPPPHTRRVLFMGDSTLVTRPANPSSSLLGRQLARHGVAAVYDVFPGNDVFHHYCVSGAFLAWKPDAVIVVVNPRMMRAKRRAGAATNLCSFLPTRQLLRSLALPWHDRGASLVRLGLTKALAVEPVEDAVVFLEGLRRLFADRWTGPSAAAAARSRTRALRRSAASWDQPLSPRHPLVRVLGALVSEAHRSGARVLVVVTPAPLHWMERAVRYDAAVWRQRHAALRAAVTEAGGELLDLHDLLGPSGFRDTAGHMTPHGHARVANAVSAGVHGMLDLRPPDPLPVPDPSLRQALAPG